MQEGCNLRVKSFTLDTFSFMKIHYVERGTWEILLSGLEEHILMLLGI